MKAIVEAGPKSSRKRTERRNSQRDSEPALKIKTILVPIDFSRASLQAIPWAKFFAHAMKAKIELVHVYGFEIPLPEGITSPEKGTKQETEALLASLPKKVRQKFWAEGNPAHMSHQKRERLRRDLQGRTRDRRRPDRVFDPRLHRMEAHLSREHRGTNRSPCALPGADRATSRARARAPAIVAQTPRPSRFFPQIPQGFGSRGESGAGVSAPHSACFMSSTRTRS